MTFILFQNHKQKKLIKHRLLKNSKKLDFVKLKMFIFYSHIADKKNKENEQ